MRFLLTGRFDLEKKAKFPRLFVDSCDELPSFGHRNLRDRDARMMGRIRFGQKFLHVAPLARIVSDGLLRWHLAVNPEGLVDLIPLVIGLDHVHGDGRGIIGVTEDELGNALFADSDCSVRLAHLKALSSMNLATSMRPVLALSSIRAHHESGQFCGFGHKGRVLWLTAANFLRVPMVISPMPG